MAALDTSQQAAWSTGNTIVTPTLAASGANRLIMVWALVVAASGDISSVTGGGVTFTRRVDVGLPDLQLWVGYATGTFNSAITVAFSGTIIDGGVHAAAFTDVPSSSYFDTDAGLPVYATGFSAGDGDPLSTDTDGTYTIITAGFRTNSPTNSAGSGWTQIQTGAYLTTMYQIVTSPQTALSATLGTPDTALAGIVDAVIYIPASAGTGGRKTLLGAGR